MDALTAATISHPHASKALCSETPAGCTLSGSAPRLKRSVSLIGSSKPIRASSSPSKQRSFSLRRRSSTAPAFDLDQHTLELDFRSITTPEQRYKVAGVQQMAKEKSMTNVQDAQEILQNSSTQDSDPFKTPALVGRSLPSEKINGLSTESDENKEVSSDDSESIDSTSPKSSIDSSSPPTLLSDYPSGQFGSRSISSWNLPSSRKGLVEEVTDSAKLGRGPRGGALVGRSLSTNDLNSFLAIRPIKTSTSNQRHFSTESLSSSEESASSSPSKNQSFSPRQFEDAVQQFEPVDAVYEGAWEQVEKIMMSKKGDHRVGEVLEKKTVPASGNEVFSPRQFEDAIHQYEPLESVQQQDWHQVVTSLGDGKNDGTMEEGQRLDPVTRSATHEAPEPADTDIETPMEPESTPPMSPESNNLDLHLRSAAIALEELRESVLQRPRSISSQVTRSSTLPHGFQSVASVDSVESSKENPLARTWSVDQRRSRRSDLVSFLNHDTADSNSSTPEMKINGESPMVRGRSSLRSRESGSGSKVRRREFGQLSQSNGLVTAAKEQAVPVDQDDLDSSSLVSVSKLISRSPSLAGQEGLGGGIGLGLFEVAQSKVEKVESPKLSKKDLDQVFYDAREALEDEDDGVIQSPEQGGSTANAGTASTSQTESSKAPTVGQYKPSTSKIDHTTHLKKKPQADLSELPTKKKGSTIMRGRHYNVTGKGASSSSNSPSTSSSTSWSCTTTASSAPKTKSWTSALAASSVPSSPQLLASPTMGSASGSPMLNGTPTMSAPGTPMETQSAFGGDAPVQPQPAATPAYDGTGGAPSDSAPGFQASVATIIAASAIGSLMLIGAIIWAALFRRRRSKRRRHLAGVLEKFGAASSSDIHSDGSSKSSMSMSRSSKDTLVDADRSGTDEKKMGMGHIGAGIGYGTSDFGKVVGSKPVESKAFFVAQKASARASALNIVSPWSNYNEGNGIQKASKAGPHLVQEDGNETEDEEAARGIGLGLVVHSDARFSSRMSKDLARSGLVSEALAPVRDATFSWQHPTLSLPPAAARALATGHYVKKRTTLPAKARIPVPPMIAPLSSLGASASSAFSRADSEGSVAIQRIEACSSSSCIDPDFDADSTMGTFAHSKISGLSTAKSQPNLPQRHRSDSNTTAGGSATTTSRTGIALSTVATDGSVGRNGWLSRMLGGLQSSSSSREGLGDSTPTSAAQSANGDSGVSASISDGEFAEVRFVTGRASLGHGSASPQLQSTKDKTSSQRYSNDPLLAFVSSGVASQEISKQQARAKVVSGGSARRNPNWHSSLPACREESEETVFVIGGGPHFDNFKSNVSQAGALLGRGLGDLIEDTSGSEDERKSGYDAGGETDADSRISNFVPVGKPYKTSNDAMASKTPLATRSSMLGPHGVGSHRTLPQIRVPSITLTLEDETLGEVERPLSLGSHSEGGTTSEEEIMAMIGRAPAYNPHINPRVSSNVRESTQSAASFFSSNSSDEENDTEDAYDDHSGRTSRAGNRSSRSSRAQSNRHTASSSSGRASQDSIPTVDRTPRSADQQAGWSNSDRPDSETDAEGVYQRYEDEIDLDGYGSESAEGCLELSDFPTLPSWTPAEKAAHEAARADKSAYRSQSIKKAKK